MRVTAFCRIASLQSLSLALIKSSTEICPVSRSTLLLDGIFIIQYLIISSSRYPFFVVGKAFYGVSLHFPFSL